jgi:Holliday junction resolvasome RuvABC ATP-dependent DNA helicase subunit
MSVQHQLAFFDPTANRSMPHLPEKPSDDEIRMILAENNQRCPLNQVVVSAKNEGNMRNLRRFAFSAYKNANRSCRGCNFGIFSPPGQGKTFVVKRFAETIGIPFVFVQSPMLENSFMLFEQISEAFSKVGTPLVQQKDKKYDFILPPCIVFFDEAHELRSSMMKGSLLNAMEPDDATMIIKTPGAKGQIISVDSYEVCWVAATTDRGDLFDAFDSRLTTTIEWHPSEGDELINIIKSGLKTKAKLGEIDICPPDQICAMIAKYQKVPRLAIHGFGTKVVQHKSFMPSCSWEECCKIVASDIGLNKYGLTEKQVAILKALGQRPIAEARLADIARCRVAQVKKYELPGLMQYSDDGPYVVSLSGKGMAITKNGLALLDRLNIDHKGAKVTAEYHESRR